MKMISLRSKEKLHIVSSVSYLFQDYVSTVFLAFVLLFILLKYVYIHLQKGLCCLETTLAPNLLNWEW